MVHSANGHRTRKGGNSGAPPGLNTTAPVPYSAVAADETADSRGRRPVSVRDGVGDPRMEPE